MHISPFCVGVFNLFGDLFIIQYLSLDERFNEVLNQFLDFYLCPQYFLFLKMTISKNAGTISGRQFHPPTAFIFPF